jgi:hypothetical protein
METDAVVEVVPTTNKEDVHVVGGTDGNNPKKHVPTTNKEDVHVVGGTDGNNPKKHRIEKTEKNVMIVQDQQKALDENEEALEENLVVTCKYCEQSPCWLEQGLYDRIVELEESIRDEAINQKLNNKQIRFQLYREATTFIHGHLGKRRRVELPCCVRGEVLDLAPDPDGLYTGFKEPK